MSELCSALHHLCDQGERFRFPFEAGKIPSNGIYVLFEVGEGAQGVDRVVRVGTHTGTNRLRSRLQEHFINENKDRSIFRKNIGRALLNRARDPFLRQWNWDLTSRKAREAYRHKVDFGRQREVERQVTEYIQNNFSFVVFRVDDKEPRLTLESKIVSTVSLCDECRASERWLGLYSPKPRIRRSGLWQEQGLYKTPLSKPELAELRKWFLFSDLIPRRS